MMKPVAKLLQQYCDLLLQEDSSWAARKKCLEQMHELFVELGALDAYDDESRSAAKAMDGGIAIAPTWAAMCMFDIARTRQFVLGLRAAISDRLSEKRNEPIQVLDAGCGPYALLALLTSLYFSPEQVQYTLLDIFPGNIESAQKLVSALGMEHSFNAFVCEDALHYQWPKKKSLHILVTETMNRALWKEPQVAISLHLAPQLAPEGILIPDRIEVNLLCIERYKKEDLTTSCEIMENTGHSLNEDQLGSIIELNKNSKAADILKRPLSRITLPAHFNEAKHELELDTRVKIYKEIELKKNESAITLPQHIGDRGMDAWQPGDELCFYYEFDGVPGIVWSTKKSS